ncbi:DUF695 domain-containing protein [Maribacter sp.]|uniref:DUF695 domain-containing protein n=1 Tax=Maribacter sp. TaxID=1897614 RepID=UPI0025BEA2CC|nr:DUF695 domain-containing protein [Maribacter sp.]
MGLFDIFSLNKEKVDCSNFKNEADIYPENSISVVMTQSENGMPATGWVDMGYVEYKFKRCCPFNLQFTVEIPEDNDELDYGTVEDYLVEELKKGCVTHPVSRVATDFGFIMDVYVDDAEFASKKLTEMFEDENKIVEFGCGFNKDPNWKEYKRIIKNLG